MLASQTDKHWRKGYVTGAFDMFHIGHLNLLRRARERCDYLVVGVLSDEAISASKKKLPIIPLEERLEIVSALGCVDETDVTTQALMSKTAAWEKYRFDVVFSGDDHAHDGWASDEHDLASLGADTVFFPYTRAVSSTRLAEIALPPKSQRAQKSQRTGGFTHIFPFDRVDKGERVIIYGTGDVGGQYARQLLALEYCHVDAFADTYAKPGEVFLGKPCVTPRELTGEAYRGARIVIATAKYHDEIMETLMGLGIAPGRIV